MAGVGWGEGGWGGGGNGTAKQADIHLMFTLCIACDACSKNLPLHYAKEVFHLAKRPRMMMAIYVCFVY